MIFVMVRIPLKSATVVNPNVELAITAIALINLLVGLCGRPFLGRLAKYNRQTTKPAPLQRWLTANVFSLACMDSCMLFGFVLHILRARIMVVELLFGAAMISLFFWSPGTPPTVEDGQTRAS